MASKGCNYEPGSLRNGRAESKPTARRHRRGGRTRRACVDRSRTLQNLRGRVKQREPVALIGPGGHVPESRLAQHFTELLEAVLVAVLGMDALSGLEAA